MLSDQSVHGDKSLEERVAVLEAEMHVANDRQDRIEQAIERLSNTLEERMKSDEQLVREMTSTIIRATASISHLTEVVSDLKQAVSDNAAEVININNKLFRFEGIKGTLMTIAAVGISVMAGGWAVFTFLYDKLH